MESKTLLDYALFQLTPTRTRCDLVIFSGKNKEKIATGLLEPYVSHLKSAKDQISKGGYSITLKPPSNDSSNWFTKATLQSFVRFVSTPEVLERFVTIEREMDQIDQSSVEDPKTPVAASKSRDIEAEEITPKIRLQRVLESRKAMLKKEQAMAYARALVAGFETDCLHDLVSFSDAFGAHRLREACVNFMELCNKKHDDKIWMNEVEAMQASYLGTSENHDPSSQAVPQKGSDSGEGTENGFPTEVNPQQTHHLHNYMQQHDVQAPVFQPYPGYNMFPGLMQVGTSRYPWPGNFHNPGPPHDTDISGSRRKNKSRKKKEKHRDEENNVESSDADQSSSRSNSSDKNHIKKSSRKVVIRNINYIASSRDEKSSDDDDSGSYSSSDESLKMQHKPNSNKIKKAIVMSKDAENEGTLVASEEGKKDGNWDIFQNLLMREPDANETDTGSKSIHIQEEYIIDNKKSYTGSKFASDDFLPIERSNGNGLNKGEMDRFITEHPTVKTRDEEDWILGTNPKRNNTSIDDDHDIFSGDQASENRKVDVFSDDSFMVQSRVSDDTRKTQPPSDDIIMVTEVIGSTQSKNNDSYEPEDLKMMLGQDPVTERDVTSWSHDMETTLTSRIKPEPSNDKASKTGTDKDSGRKVGGKESKTKALSGSLGRSKSDIPPRSKIAAAGNKMSRSKSETEEDKRKKMEELSKQRQKRIAERSAAAKGVVTPEASRRSAKEVKKTTSIINPSKDKARTLTGQENKKSNKTVMMRSSTIDRLATSRTTNKQLLSTQPKIVQNRKPLPLVKKTKGTQEQQKVKVINPSDKKNGGKNNISSDKPEKIVKVSSFEKREADSNVSDNVINADDDRAVELTTPPQSTVNPKVDEKPLCHEKKKLTFSPEISVREISSSTPAPDDETNLEHSRKKWNNGESSPKIPKGFRRLLLFGRRN